MSVVNHHLMVNSTNRYKTANITFSTTLQNSYFTITQCQKNPADCVMVKLEFCNVEKVIFAVLYLQPLGHPYSVVINWTVFTRHSCTGRYCWEGVLLAMGILSVRLSVCPGVTTRYWTKPRWDRDSRSWPYDSLVSLVSNEVILVPLGEEIPLERGHQIRVPP